jgi:hypothetical protein
MRRSSRPVCRLWRWSPCWRGCVSAVNLPTDVRPVHRCCGSGGRSYRAAAGRLGRRPVPRPGSIPGASVEPGHRTPPIRESDLVILLPDHPEFDDKPVVEADTALDCRGDFSHAANIRFTLLSVPSPEPAHSCCLGPLAVVAGAHAAGHSVLGSSCVAHVPCRQGAASEFTRASCPTPTRWCRAAWRSGPVRRG